MSRKKAPSIEQTPGARLDEYVAVAAAQNEPIAIDSEQGIQLYRTLAQHVWREDRAVTSLLTPAAGSR